MSENSFLEQRKIRMAKLAGLRLESLDYVNGFKPKNQAQLLQTEFANDVPENFQVTVAGRVMTKRLMGKACFITLKDSSGSIQIYLRKNDLTNYNIVEDSDLGDIVFIAGRLFRTQKGELSVWAETLHLLTKALRPLPDKYHGLSDIETRYRKRYLDLISNEDAFNIMKMRSLIVGNIRNFFTEKGFIEVETPMMQVQPGGANAKPFKTHLKALDLPLYLRIAPELYLKRLIVGGFDKVFELNKNFRNEGMSTRHNPEFTMVEFYQAYATYIDMMDLTEELFKYLRSKLNLPKSIEYNQKLINIADPFKRISLEDLLKQKHKLNDVNIRDKNALLNLCEKENIKIDPNQSIGAIQLMIFEETIEESLQDPTFVIDYPMDVSPLARKKDTDPFLSDRFELFIVGRELANGFSELNDPEDQAERFNKQMELRDKGDDEAMSFDHDYICALEHGMPPTAGQGIGVDRLVMLLTNQLAIRDVILFPTMRPKDD